MNLFNDPTCPALLRTHYCTDEEERARHDDLMTEWVDSDHFEPEAWWAVLNDADLFNFGAEWRRVYEILPELAGPLDPEVDDKLRIPRARKAEDLEPFRSDLKTQIAEVKEEAPEAWRDDRDTIIDSLAIGLQKCAKRAYLILADEEAFRSGSLYVLYLDGFRNVIREGRMDPEIHDLFGVVGTWVETNEFLEGSTVGEKYRASAELGRELYQLTEEELADPNQ